MKDYDVKELFEQLAKLDKEISSIENKKKNYFFDNIDIKDKEGNVELPLVATNNSSDYENLKHEKRYIKMQIKQLLKQAEKDAQIIAALPRKYAKNYDVDYVGQTYESLDILECVDNALESVTIPYYTQRHQKKYRDIIVYKQYRCKCYLCGNAEFPTVTV